MRAPDFMAKGISDMQDRAALRDTPEGERSMAKTVAAFNAIYGTSLTETQGWQFMALLKVVRGSQGQFHADDHVDQTTYSALAGESAFRAHASSLTTSAAQATEAMRWHDSTMTKRDAAKTVEAEAKERAKDEVWESNQAREDMIHAAKTSHPLTEPRYITKDVAMAPAKSK